MKWYQVFECDNTVKNPLVCDIDNFEKFGIDETIFKLGKKVEIDKNILRIQSSNPNDDGEPDDALQSHLMIPIFSKRLITELETANIKGIQYIPINVFQSNDDAIEGYCIANLLFFISAFDYEKSIYNRFRDNFPNIAKRGKIAGVKKFVLKKNKLYDVDIIRLEDYKQRFFVSEKFKNIFESNKFTGYSFKEIELT
ncbi:MAG: hypothetical protein JXL97_19425 [Bacteroidales bacterium]|nr:hypothetical protein [Bacteroidales bacterium]